MLVQLLLYGARTYGRLFFNREQSVFLKVSLDYGTTKVIVLILVLLLIFLKIFELNYFNKDLLVSMLELYIDYVRVDRYKVMFTGDGIFLGMEDFPPV